ncbi:MAG: bile acid:sodium symporter family protein [Spirochaetes bacterium]|nr:bile acid:sodium symporter family protein [Spirochaetota bacterium]
MIQAIDQLKLNFSPDSLILLNITLAFIMFGVALQLKSDNFKEVFRNPRSVIIGILSQFLLLPAATFLLIQISHPAPSIALGMILVAACPGGNISNFISSLSRSNTELSVSLTAFSTIGALVMTPLNFTFWAGLNDSTAAILRKITLDPLSMFETVMVLLCIPLIAGIFISKKFPGVTKKITSPIRSISLVIFFAYIAIALASNFDALVKYFMVMASFVFIHNAMALVSGYVFGKSLGLAERDSRTISIETGIQNSGLGLILIFNFFDGLGGMAYIAALWGIWHLISGFLLALYWSHRPVSESPAGGHV